MMTRVEVESFHFFSTKQDVVTACYSEIYTQYMIIIYKLYYIKFTVLIIYVLVLPQYNTVRIYKIYQKPKRLFVWEGRPDFSFLFKSCEIDRSQGRLIK